MLLTVGELRKQLHYYPGHTLVMVEDAGAPSLARATLREITAEDAEVSGDCEDLVGRRVVVFHR